MTETVERILVGVSGSSRHVLARVGELVKQTGAAVELCSVVRPVLPAFGLSYEAPKATDQAVSATRAELEALAANLRKQGCSVVTYVAVSEHVVDGLLKRVAAYKPTLVAIEAHKHSALARLLLTQTDFDLIRRCPVPLLIVKGGASKSSLVLAAVDPEHAHRKPPSLDDRILSVAQTMGSVLDARVHSAYIHQPIMGFAAGPFAPIAYPITGAEERRYRARMKALYSELCKRHGIAKRAAHAALGDPVFALPQMAEKLRARMVVMGAVSRRYLKRVLIGSTAERVLDLMPCDVLIVKPPGFRAA
jgi:universal stress protein E